MTRQFMVALFEAQIDRIVAELRKLPQDKELATIIDQFDQTIAEDDCDD